MDDILFLINAVEVDLQKLRLTMTQPAPQGQSA